MSFFQLFDQQLRFEAICHETSDYMYIEYRKVKAINQIKVWYEIIIIQIFIHLALGN